MIYRTEDRVECMALIEAGKVKHVFDTSERWEQAVLEEFTPCIVTSLTLARWLTEEGYLQVYDAGSYDVLGYYKEVRDAPPETKP